MHTYKINTAPIAGLVRSKKPRVLSIQPSEHEMQCAVIQWARLHEAQYPPLELLHATPNGGLRHKGVAMKLKAEGVRAGYPDLSLDWPAHGFHGLRIELKTNIGKLRKEQAWWLDRLTQAGVMAVVCRGDKAAIDTIKSYLGIV